MTASLIVVALGAVAAVVGTGALTARCSRAPSLFLVAWTAALFCLAVALAAQALGYLAGFSDLVFRCAEIGAQALAPLALCLGLVELIGRSVVARFAMRLTVAAIGVIVLVIMGSDPLSPGVTLGTSWPDPAAVYQLVPAGLIKFLAVFAVITGLAAGLVLLARSGRGPASADVVRPGLIASVATVTVALPGVAMLAGSSLGAGGSAFAVALAAALTWFAANSAARLGLAGAGATGAGATGAGATGNSATGNSASREQDRRGPRGAGRPGSYDRRSDRFDAQDTAGRYPASGYGDDAGYGAPGYGDDSEIGYPALAALAAERSDPADGSRADGYRGDRYRAGGDFGIGDYGAGEGGPRERDARPGDADPQASLFGQITIYTLLEERIDEFDRMTEQVVEQVRAREPGTLVYIVHAVPTAPMQRILYEVYRDRPAYEDHLARPYMARYTAERRSMVLATNAIELGLQQAKVSPLPSYSAISDILSESGIDLTGVTRSRRGVPAGAGDRHGRSAASELSAPGSGRYSRDDPDDDGPEYDGWVPEGGEGGYR